MTDLPDRKAPALAARLLPVMAIFMAITLSSLGLTYFALSVHSTARALVQGEGLWSKAQRDAMFYIDKYVETRNPQDYRKFQQALAITEGDRRARLELQKPDFDYEVAAQGLRAGGNDPADIPGIIRLLHCCSQVSYIDRAVGIWAQGDTYVLALEAVGHALQTEIASPQPSQTRIDALLAQLLRIDSALRPLEKAFSATLGEAARWLQRVLLIATSVIVVGLIVLGTYVSTRLIKAVAQSEAKAQLLLDTANDAFVVIDLKTAKVLDVNRQGERMTGLSLAELVGMRYLELYPAHQQALVHTAHLRTVNNEGNGFTRLDMRHRAGHVIPVEVSVSTLRWEGRTVNLAIIRDITERVRAEQELRTAANALAHIAEPVMVADRRQRIIAVNRAFTAVSGYKAEEIRGKPLMSTEAGQHEAAFFDVLWRTVHQDGQWHGEISQRRKNDEVYPAHLSVSAVRGDDGETTHYVGVFNDISQYKDYEERLEYMAHYDALTELPNRILFEEKLKEAISRARRHQLMVGLLFIDLDGFKAINDRHGHALGDQVLKSVAARIKNCVRGSDAVSRLGGDEFTVLVDAITDADEASVVARKLLKILAEPTIHEGHALSVFASIGISCYPSHGADPKTLLKNADTAMYRAKQQGRNTYRLFSPDPRSSAVTKLEIVAPAPPRAKEVK